VRNLERNHKAKQWGRIAMKVGLLFADPKVRAAIRAQFRDRVDDANHAISEKYEDTVDRLEAAHDALRGRSQWFSHAAFMLVGIGVGAGIGILLTPASGEETRRAIRDKAEQMRDKVADSTASMASRVRASVASMPVTGTEA
jgi:YtxH-like protein